MVMNVRYVVELDAEELETLQKMVAQGSERVRRIERAQVLLAAHRGHTDAMIAAAASVGTSTVCRTKRRFVEGGLGFALSEAPRPGRERKLSGEDEALLVAIACWAPPEGSARWTLELLAGEMVRRTTHEALSRETVRRRLEERQLKPWCKSMWCIPSVRCPCVTMKRNAPCAETAEIRLTLNLAPVVLTTGVSPTGAHVVPL
jgi:transposase